MTANPALTFADVIHANRTRCRRWHHPDTEPWTGADWSNAMCGEAGEAANVVKKLRRHETRTSSPGDPDEKLLMAQLGFEIADTILYALLLADHYGIDVPKALVAKFNLVSARQEFPERLLGPDDVVMPEALGDEDGERWWLMGHVHPHSAVLAVLAEQGENCGPGEMHEFLFGPESRWDDRTRVRVPRTWEERRASVADALASVSYRWGLSRDEEHWDWVDADTPGAFPVTEVTC